MEFIKWPSITNSYNTKFVSKFLEEYPELANETYVITEKIHGANLQLGFSPNETMQVGSRTCWLKEGKSFFGVWEVLKKYESVLSYIQELVNSQDITLRLFAELYGKGIQKEIIYSDTKNIRFFGEMLGNDLKPFQWVIDFVEQGLGFIPVQGIEDTIYVPIIAEVVGLQAALDYNIEFPTALNPVEGNICEGVVIQPLWKVYKDHLGQTFLLKKKNAKFMETQRVKKELKQEPDEVMKLNELFKTYITEMRLDTLFSKVGPIESDTQIGEYIRLFIDDAKKDFIEDYAEELSGLETKQERKVYNVGSTIANMLKARLNNG